MKLTVLNEINTQYQYLVYYTTFKLECSDPINQSCNRIYALQLDMVTAKCIEQWTYLVHAAVNKDLR